MPELISPLELMEEDELQEGPGDVADVDRDAVRELVLRAHPDVVPEMIAGDSLAAMIASVEPARAAYTRLAEGWNSANPRPAPVPAGGGVALPVDPEALPPAEKIRRGLKATASRRGTQEQ